MKIDKKILIECIKSGQVSAAQITQHIKHSDITLEDLKNAK